MKTNERPPSIVRWTLGLEEAKALDGPVQAFEPYVKALFGSGPRGAMLRAYDKKGGQQVGEVWMPAIQSGSPMTYMTDGKQYIVVAISGGNYTGEYMAFRLPN